ncbi:hypothetical protein K461DRAFT_171816 [Myriangium duriaei CBS 260.36]|uniref:Uncharacterized protein n=1 Tax=Myriangium duriaei CBS 260.36 TaxID=1168546 RepID=A0A9P4J2S6_9PEZI|nr:hypothetical protein K461DRAFT_171816 [Myriangium duriaei CBS 260.36]
MGLHFFSPCDGSRSLSETSAVFCAWRHASSTWLSPTGANSPSLRHTKRHRCVFACISSALAVRKHGILFAGRSRTRSITVAEAKSWRRLVCG